MEKSVLKLFFKNSEKTYDEIELLKANGLLFDSIVIDHEGAVDKAMMIKGKVSLKAVTGAFIASLSTRRLEWRSALASYIELRSFSDHKFIDAFSAGMKGSSNYCLFCRLPESADVKNFVNDISFYRYKYGGRAGVTDSILYAIYDLTWFLNAKESISPTDRDIDIFRQVIATIDNLDDKVTAPMLQKYLTGLFPSNKDERDTLIVSLGIMGVLDTEKYPGFFHKYHPITQRSMPDKHFVSLDYPVWWWTGIDGVNKSNFNAIFGDYMTL